MSRHIWKSEHRGLHAHVIQWRYQRISHVSWLIDPVWPQCRQMTEYFEQRTAIDRTLQRVWELEFPTRHRKAHLYWGTYGGCWQFCSHAVADLLYAYLIELIERYATQGLLSRQQLAALHKAFITTEPLITE